MPPAKKVDDVKPRANFMPDRRQNTADGEPERLEFRDRKAESLKLSLGGVRRETRKVRHPGTIAV